MQRRVCKGRRAKEDVQRSARKGRRAKEGAQNHLGRCDLCDDPTLSKYFLSVSLALLLVIETTRVTVGTLFSIESLLTRSLDAQNHLGRCDLGDHTIIRFAILRVRSSLKRQYYTIVSVILRRVRLVEWFGRRAKECAQRKARKGRRAKEGAQRKSRNH